MDIQPQTPQAQNINQTANAGGDSLQVGGNYTSSTTSSTAKTNNFYISLFIIGILALGGVSLAISLMGDSSQDSTSPQSNPPTEIVE